MQKFKPQYRRLLFIDRKIRDGKYPNCQTLATDYEVSPRTIQRDIDYLKFQLEAPIDYCHSNRGYYYTEENYRLPAITITESDLFTVLIAERALKQFQSTPLYNKLAPVFEKFSKALSDRMIVHPAWIDSRVFFFPEPSTEIDAQIWETLAAALRDDRRLRIMHKSAGREKALGREVDPYYLVNYKGEWYLNGHCHRRGSIRTFAVSRISDATILEQSFQMPEEYSHEKMFGDQFGIVWQDKKHDVRIRFTAAIAPYIQERQWHPAQNIKANKDGSIVLRFTTNHIKEVKDWVLRWGPEAKVLGPPELREELIAALRKALAAYG